MDDPMSIFWMAFEDVKALPKTAVGCSQLLAGTPGIFILRVHSPCRSTSLKLRSVGFIRAGTRCGVDCPGRLRISSRGFNGFGAVAGGF